MFEADAEVMFGDCGGRCWLTVVSAPMVKPLSRRTCPEVRLLPEVISLLMTRRAIDPSIDNIVELSMKAPMSVSKLADLG